MRITTSKSKNAESFYISKRYINDKGVSTSVIVRKLGTLNELIKEHRPTRDDVMRWAKEEAKTETEKYKKEREAKSVQITFHADRQMDCDKQIFYRSGYLFLQSVYYGLQMNKICRKLKNKYKFKYDINAILSDLIYAKVLEPASKRSSYKTASEFMEKPTYGLHDVYRALEKKLDYKYTCEEILDTLKTMNFAEIQEQGFIPLYRRQKITDALYEACGFHTDFQFITKSQMKTIQKKSKGKE